MEPVFLVPAVFSAVLAVIGVAERDRGRIGPLGLLAVCAVAVATLVYLVSTHDPDVGTSDFVLGLVLGTAAIGLLPGAAFYWLGRALGARPGFLIAVWLLTQRPLAFYIFVALIFAVGLTHCPPDAYECPL